MFKQTISLFRYLLLGVVNRRMAIFYFILLALSYLLSDFFSDLAIINSQKISGALQGDFLRYSLIFLALLMVTNNVADDFRSNQFEQLLTMPISRWQYVVAQLLVIFFVATALSFPVAAVLSFSVSLEVALYWSAALWLEIILVSLIGLLGILSLEKMPQAVVFSTAVYLLAKFAGVISQMLTESVKLTDGGVTNHFATWVFEGVLHLMPSAQAFAQNNVFFDPSLLTLDLWLSQFMVVAIYAVFLVGVCLIDFYRKEFNR